MSTGTEEAEQTGGRLLLKVLLSGGGSGLLVVLFVFSLMILGAAAGANSSDGAGDGNAFNPPPTAGPVVSGEWAAPEAGVGQTSGFGPRDTSGCAVCSSVHEGIDLSGGCGTPIYAASAGTVRVGGLYGGYGNAVIIDHADGIATLYGHMPWGQRIVNAGDVVVAGQQIGSEGQTGNSFGCHLHLEVWSNGTKIDPAAFFAARGITWPVG